GRFLYLGFTRPDLTYAIQQLSQFMHNPCQTHWNATLHVVRYLKGCLSYGLFYSSSTGFDISAYCDADWAACPLTRRSLTGYCIFLGSSPISWKTKKQSIVSRSSAEAEYRSMSFTVAEVQWITYLLQDFGLISSLPIPLWCDNQAA